MSHIQKTIKEFENVASLLIYVKDINGKPECFWQIAQIKSFILSSHLNYLLEEKKRLEGEIRDIPYAPETDKMFADRIFNSAITKQLEYLEEEIEEINKML